MPIVVSQGTKIINECNRLIGGALTDLNALASDQPGTDPDPVVQAQLNQSSADRQADYGKNALARLQEVVKNIGTIDSFVQDPPAPPPPDPNAQQAASAGQAAQQATGS